MAVLAALLAGCERRAAVNSSPEVVAYVSVDDHIARPILEDFEKQAGISVLIVSDTEATKTTGLVQRLRAEAAHPRADVLWSSEVFMTIALAGGGLLEPHSSATTAQWPAAFKDPADRWHAFANRARVAVFNTERVSASEAPRSMHDLLDPRFKGRLVVARPAFGTTRGHMSALVAMWGDEEAQRWLRAMRDNGLRLLDGNSAIVRAVATGEADVGLTDTDDVWAGQRNGWPIDLVYIRHDLPQAVGETPPFQGGPLLIPNTVARIRGGPNPEGAAILIDYLLSAQVERLLAESDSHNIPIRTDMAAEFPRFAVPDPADVRFEDIAAAMEPAMRLCEQEWER